MIVTALVIGGAVLALIYFVLGGFRAARTPPRMDTLIQSIEPVDLEAFRNLTEPSEEEFLRMALSPAAFRSLQRERLRAAIDYLAGVSHNAAILLQMGQVARRSEDPQVAEAGSRLTDDALRLRIYSMMAICKLGLRYAFPEGALQAGGVIDRYQHLTSAALRLGRMQGSEKGA